MPGSLLAGRYEVGGLLGRGGMATVYRGTDRVLGRDVAIKVLAPGLAGDPDAVERFRREATAAAALNHPGIVTVFDSGSEGDRHYIVMELVEGRTLGSILAERGSLPPETALTVAARVADALAYAHVAGVVHRDVKPGNIMVSRGSVKVMDFGIARVVSSHTITETAAILGTASYLAPEQAQGWPVDARTDVYALGVVLYQMLTGRPPFVGDSPVAIAVKHVSEEPVPPSELNEAVPPEVDAEVLRALAKDPNERHGSAAALARGLDALRGDLLPGSGDTLGGSQRLPAGASGAAGPPAPDPILGRPWRRIAAVAAVAAVAVLGVGFLRPEAAPSSEDGREPGVVRPTGRPDRAQDEGMETEDAFTTNGGAARSPATPSPSPGDEDPTDASTGEASGDDGAKEPPEEPVEEPPEQPTEEPTEDPTEPPPPSPPPSPGTDKGLSGAS